MVTASHLEQVMILTCRLLAQKALRHPQYNFQLNKFVENLIKHNTSQKARPSNGFVKPDCISKHAPGNMNMMCSKWIKKIEQLGKINYWDESARIFQMQGRLTRLAHRATRKNNIIFTI